MKWVIATAVIVVLLLLLLLGFATDWTRGLHGSSSGTTPISSNLDSLHSGTTTTTPANTSGGGGTNSTSTGEHSSTTTTNNSTTTTTNNGGTTPGQPSSGLLGLLSGISIGDNINDVTKQANLLGIAASCHTDVLIQTCTFDDGSGTITTKDIAGTGVITSVTKNF